MTDTKIKEKIEQRKTAEEIRRTVCYDEQGRYKGHESVVEAMEQYASQKQDSGVRWVRASERSPEKGERVLCYTIYGIQIGWITSKGDWQFMNEGSQFTLEYWMPFPELPNSQPKEQPLTP